MKRFLLWKLWAGNLKTSQAWSSFHFNPLKLIPSHPTACSLSHMIWMHAWPFFAVWIRGECVCVSAQTEHARSTSEWVSICSVCLCVCSAVTKTELDLRDIADEIKRNSSIFQHISYCTELKTNIGFDLRRKQHCSGFFTSFTNLFLLSKTNSCDVFKGNYPVSLSNTNVCIIKYGLGPFVTTLHFLLNEFLIHCAFFSIIEVCRSNAGAWNRDWRDVSMLVISPTFQPHIWPGILDSVRVRLRIQWACAIGRLGADK